MGPEGVGTSTYEKKDWSGRAGAEVGDVTSKKVAANIPFALNVAFEKTSQSPAVNEIDTKLIRVPLVNEIAPGNKIKLLINSPTYPVIALLLVVVPTIPWVVGLNATEPKVGLPVQLVMSPEAGVPKAIPLGIVVDIEGTPEPFVTNNELLAVANKAIADEPEYTRWLFAAVKLAPVPPRPRSNGLPVFIFSPVLTLTITAP